MRKGSKSRSYEGLSGQQPVCSDEFISGASSIRRIQITETKGHEQRMRT